MSRLTDASSAAAYGPDAGSRASAAGDRRLAALIFWGLIAVLAWAPLPFASNTPWAWSLLALTVGILVILWALAQVVRPQLLRLSWRLFAIPGLLFGATLGWAMVQTTGLLPAGWHDPLWQEAGRALHRPLAGVISADPVASLGGIMRLMSCGGIFWLAAQYGRDRSHARRIVWGIAAIGIAYAIYGLAVFATGNRTILWFDRWAYEGDLTGTFVSRAAYGTYAGLGLLCALTLVIRTVERTIARDREGRGLAVHLLESLPPAFYLLAAGCLTLATVVLLTHSRGAVVVAALGTTVILAAMVAGRRDRRRQRLVFALCIAIAGIALLDISGRVTLGRTLFLADQGTGRDAVHGLTVRAIETAPVAGFGLDTFADSYFRFRDMSVPWESPRYDKAHSVYLELAMELGVPGAVAFLTAIAAVLCCIALGIARRRRNAHYPILGLGATVLVGAQGLFDFGIQMPAVAVTYAALLGVAFAQSWPTRQAGSHRAGSAR